MPLPMEKQASWGLQHHGQAGMARSDSTKAWLHQSMGAGLGMGMGVLQGRAWPLQCHGGWEGGRAWLDQPHTSAPAPSGLHFKSTCWGNNKDNVAQINALDFYPNGCWEPAPLPGSGSSGVCTPSFIPPLPC